VAWRCRRTQATARVGDAADTARRERRERCEAAHHPYGYGSAVPSAGELASAASAGGAEVTMPLWLVILLAVIAALVPFVASWLTYKAASVQVRTGAETAAAQRALERDKGHADLILKAAELVRGPEPVSVELGFAMLDGIAEMPNLSKDNAELVVRLTQRVFGARLEQVRRVAKQEAKPPSTWRRITGRDKGKGGESLDVD
jgi:hypothetical protein